MDAQSETHALLDHEVGDRGVSAPHIDEGLVIAGSGPHNENVASDRISATNRRQRPILGKATVVFEEHCEVMDLRMLENNHRAIVNVWLKSCVGENALCHGEPHELSVESCPARLD